MITAVPTVEEVAEELNKPVAVVGPALLAELDDQAARCVTNPYNDALRAALVRRVSRHLEMKNIPLGVQVQEFGAMYVGGNDREIARLEAPHRRMAIG